jgi:hypothetical protein
MKSNVRRIVQVAVLGAVFGSGFVVGSVTQRDANADVKSLGGAAMDAAGEGGGALGAASKLGTTVTDMQTQVEGLQKNLAVLKQVQGMLGG